MEEMNVRTMTASILAQAAELAIFFIAALVLASGLLGLP
jgi:hypothetical protein